MRRPGGSLGEEARKRRDVLTADRAPSLKVSASVQADALNRMQNALEPAGVEFAQMKQVDVEWAARVHMQAFTGYANTLLGIGYVSQMYLWFVRYPKAVCIKCTVGDRLAGFAVGAPEAYGSAINRELMGQVLWRVFCRPRLWFTRRFWNVLGVRLRGVFGGARTDGEKAFSLVGIAVLSEFRGAGIGAALLDAFERSVYDLGYDLARLSVYDNNSAARHLYRRAGWLEVDRSGALITYEKRLLSEADM